MVIKPPQPIEKREKSVFLAGSIEMGAAVNWQDKVIDMLGDTDITIFNPRNDYWDATWTCSKNNPQFRKQVEWELEALENSRVVAFYFDPYTKSPISLLELGLFGRHRDAVVYCPEPFWRKGNVDIVCERYHITQVSSLEELVHEIAWCCNWHEALRMWWESDEYREGRKIIREEK